LDRMNPIIIRLTQITNVTVGSMRFSDIMEMPNPTVARTIDVISNAVTLPPCDIRLAD
jgi:hypothetical protein